MKNNHCRSHRFTGSRALTSVCWVLILLSSGGSYGASPAEKSPDVTNAVTKVVERMMEKDQIPGVAVTVVKDGSVVLLKGFGFANLDKRIPVDAEKTVFSIASLSKPFTALSALIQIRQNTLTLDSDARKLVDFALPQKFAQPVTVRQLLTHTSGFDDEEIGDSARTFDELEPLGTYLPRRMPPQIAPPGTIVKYSNHGTTLLGHIVELASKKTFADTVSDTVFRPLGMTPSTFRQQPDPEIDARRATAYRLSGKKLVPVPRYFSRVSPAWGMSTTAQDMSRFLLAQLDAGAALPDMHSTQFRQHPKMPGVTFGFFEAEMNALRALFHEGGMEGFTSYMVLVPGQRLGMFVVQNRRSGDLRRELTKAVIDHYLPSPAASPIVAAANSNLKPFAGTYRFNRSFYQHNFMKILALFGVTDEVKVSPRGGTLYLDGRHAIPVGSNLFRWQDGPGLVGFGGTPEKPSTLLFGGIPLGAYVRIAWFETALFHRVILLLAFGVFGGSLLIAGIKRMQKARAKDDRRAQKLSRLRNLTSACYVVFIPGFAAAFAMSANEFQFGVPLALRLVLVLGLIAAALTLVLAATTLWNLRRRPWSPRVLFVPVASIVTMASMTYWKILGFWF
jgi:CubicO group peptidase (beta-lactamase class C family)